MATRKASIIFTIQQSDVEWESYPRSSAEPVATSNPCWLSVDQTASNIRRTFHPKAGCCTGHTLFCQLDRQLHRWKAIFLIVPHISRIKPGNALQGLLPSCDGLRSACEQAMHSRRQMHCWAFAACHCGSVNGLCPQSSTCSTGTINSLYENFPYIPPIFPESVWAKGSSNSGGLYLIFSTSHLLIFTSSHLHTFSSSHLLIFTSSHLHIFASSHLLIFTSSHIHIFSSSHLLIFTSSHLLIFTSSHLHIFSSSHLLIFTSSYLHIFSSSHLLIFTSAHLHIFTYSHLLFLSLALTSSHTHIFSLSLSPLSSLLSLSLLSLSPFSLSFLSLLSVSPFSLPFLSLAFFIFLSLGRGWCRRGVTKRQPFHTKWGSTRKNWGKIAI